MAFKMSPIGRNKDPYESMARRGYIAPTTQKQGVGYTKQGIKIDDPEKGQATVDQAAEDNIQWSEYSDWGPHPDKPGYEIRTATGKGEAEGYHIGTEKMPDKEWREWLKTPEGQRYTASKNRSKSEERKIPTETPKEISSEIPHANVSQRMTEGEVDMGAKTQTASEPVTKIKYVMQYNAEGRPERVPVEYQVYEKPSSKETKFETQSRETVSSDYVKNNPDDKSVKTHSLTGDYDRLSKDDQQTIQDKIIKENIDKGELSDDYTVLEKEFNEKNSPNPQLSATRQLMNKYMPSKSIAKQETKTTYISSMGSEKPGVEGWKENKERYENAKRLKSHLESSGTGDEANLDLNLSYQQMLPEVEITPTPQLRGHSIATQCAKSEGGSGCVKKVGSGWKVISNKTGKYWPANYDSEASANAALKAYHAG